MRFIDQFQESHNDILLVIPNSQIKQTFVSTRDNLSGIRLRLSNANLGGNKLYQISIADSAGILRSEEISESNVGWNMALRYDFEPIVNSKNKLFTLTVGSLDKSAAEPLLTPETDLSKKYLQVMYRKEDVYQKGNAFLNETPLSGDIAFETYYSAGTAQVINNVFHNIYSHMREDFTFSAFYILLVIGLLAVIFRHLRSSLLHFSKSRRIETTRA